MEVYLSSTVAGSAQPSGDIGNSVCDVGHGGIGASALVRQGESNNIGSSVTKIQDGSGAIVSQGVGGGIDKKRKFDSGEPGCSGIIKKQCLSAVFHRKQGGDAGSGIVVTPLASAEHNYRKLMDCGTEEPQREVIEKGN